jgi:Mor family transcriptional regulator
VALRRDRDNLIRARFTGRNAAELSGQFGISIKQVLRIARGSK